MGTPFFLGIDIGGTKVSFRGESDDAQVHESSFRWTASSAVADDLRVMREHAIQVQVRCGTPVSRVGIAIAATLNEEKTVTAWPSRPSWVGLDIGAFIRELFPGAMSCYADDGDLAAAAEAREGGYTDLIYLGVGTGIGGGIVARGYLLPGPGRGSCELGHLIVNRDGERCDCGRRGCVQAEASGSATLRRAAVMRGAAVTFEELRRGFTDRTAWAVATVEQSCAAAAAALVGVGELTRPSTMIVGGGFATGIPGFVDEVARQAASLARPGHHVAPVRAARLGARSSLLGAVLAARGSIHAMPRLLSSGL